MDQFVDGKNPYTILGLTKDSSTDEVKKAYRRLALVKHPDKAKTPNAAQEFDELKKAYAILTDKSARGALDDYLDAQSAREVRLSKQDAKRQRMREDLERKEREGTRAKSEEEKARAKLQMELEALKGRAQQEHQQRRAKQQADKAAAAVAAAAKAASAADGAAAAVDSDDETTQLLLRTVKVTWDPSIGVYTTDRLRQIFAANWQVEDVILKDGKKKRKASALVVLSSQADAQRAALEAHGDIKNPLLVVPYLKVMPDHQQQQQQQGSGQHREGAAADGSPAAAATGPKQPLFASGLAGATSRPVQRPTRPLFPGALRQHGHMEEAAAGQFPEVSSAPSSNGVAQQPQPAAAGKFSSFPDNPAGQQPAVGGQFSSFPNVPSAGAKFSSFPSFPAASTGSRVAAGSFPVGSVFEDAVLGKLQHKAAAGSQKEQ